MQLSLTQEQLERIVAERVAAVLSLERVEEIAAARIDFRIKQLTVAQACERLGCRNERQLKDKCRRFGITIHRELGQKSPYVLLTEIETAQRKFGVVIPLEDSRQGTRIAAASAA